MSLYMRIPFTYENEKFTVNALKLEVNAWPMEEAYAQIVKQCPEHYSTLILGKLEQDGKYLGIVVPYSEKFHKHILDLEPLPSDAPKRKKDSHLKDASPEDVVKYGY